MKQIISEECKSCIPHEGCEGCLVLLEHNEKHLEPILELTEVISHESC